MVVVMIFGGKLTKRAFQTCTGVFLVIITYDGVVLLTFDLWVSP